MIEARLSLCLETLGCGAAAILSRDGGACWSEFLFGNDDDEALLVVSIASVGARWFSVSPSLELGSGSCSGGGPPGVLC